MKILGLSFFYHDSAACLIDDGKIIAAAQEERFSRKKHDADFPRQAIEYCLKEAKINPLDLGVVVFYDKPFLKFERILETYLYFAPIGLRSYLKAIPVWIKQKLWIPQLINKELPDFKGEVLFTEHHQSHAASAFFPSPFSEAAFLTLDGVGEWATTSWGVGRENRINFSEEIHFPHSLGLLYSAFTYYLGFKVNSGEYKVMGLAPYGEPRYRDLILKELVGLKEDGSFGLNLKYFNYPVGLTMTNHAFDRLFGGRPRQSESFLTQREMDIARSLQDVTEEIILRICRHIKKVTGQKFLCLAGGVALNCVANGKILEERIFDDIWIQPASGDAGGALGAALFVWYQYLGNKRSSDGSRDQQAGSYLGPAFSSEEIKDFIRQNKIPAHFVEQDQDLFSLAADYLAEEKVVGWFQGRMEFGPRALGNRSILGDARSPNIQRNMNLKIKFRESFRPFAPSVLVEEAGKYFCLDRPSPYMLLTAQVNNSCRKMISKEEEKLVGLDKLKIIRSILPAITHVDYSARIQTVHPETNLRYYNLIKTFFKKTGCPVIVNTSFNIRGEPIVCSPEDAYRCFMSTNLDYLVLGNFIINKIEQPTGRAVDLRSKYELD